MAKGKGLERNGVEKNVKRYITYVRNE